MAKNYRMNLPKRPGGPPTPPPTPGNQAGAAPRTGGGSPPPPTYGAGGQAGAQGRGLRPGPGGTGAAGRGLGNNPAPPPSFGPGGQAGAGGRVPPPQPGINPGGMGAQGRGLGFNPGGMGAAGRGLQPGPGGMGAAGRGLGNNPGPPPPGFGPGGGSAGTSERAIAGYGWDNPWYALQYGSPDVQYWAAKHLGLPPDPNYRPEHWQPGGQVIPPGPPGSSRVGPKHGPEDWHSNYWGDPPKPWDESYDDDTTGGNLGVSGGGGQQPGGDPWDPGKMGEWTPDYGQPEAPAPKAEAKPPADDDGTDWMDWVKGILAAGGVAGLVDWLNKQKSEGDTDTGNGDGPGGNTKDRWMEKWLGGNLGDWTGGGGGGSGSGGGDFSWVDQLGDIPGLYGDPKGGAGGYTNIPDAGFEGGDVGKYKGEKVDPPPEGDTGGRGKTGGGGTKIPGAGGRITPGP